MIVFKSRVFAVEVQKVRDTAGREREVTIVRHPPSVVLVPVQDDGRVILIRQFRASIQREIWELPAGSVDDGETAEQAAARECEEEIALVPGTIDRLGSFYPSPGFCDEEMIFFRVSGLHAPAPDSTVEPDDDEDIRAHAVTVQEAVAMLARGEIVDLKTAYGLTLLK